MHRKNMIALVLTASLLAVAASDAGAEDGSEAPPYNPYAKVLAEANIEPTLTGVTEYLQSLVPSADELAERDARVGALIAQLGASNFAQREEAMRKLAAMPDLPHDKLQAAAASDDPEIRWRSEAVIKMASRPNPLPEAVCRTIHILSIQGAAPVLLKVIPQLGPAHVRRAAEEALISSARAEDAPLLKAALASDDTALKAAAITALGAALGEEALADIRPLLESEQIEVKQAAAKALANMGDRDVLPVLLELIQHDDVNVRASSIAILRGLTGKQFGMLAYDAADKRAAAAEKWQKWIDDEGGSAELTFPLPRFAQRPEIGHTLILVYGKHKAIELNAAGETVWEKNDLNYPWAVQRLDNGNTVIGSYRGKYVVEFNPAGDEVWRKDGLPGGVFGLQRLPSGNTLLGLHSAKKAIEINQEGETVWEATFAGQPMGVQRLANGNTMVALHSGNKVVEVDREGKIVWEVSDVKIPRTVQRLEDGNTLVGDSSNQRAVEFDSDGKVVWTYKASSSVYEARRLSNGNTLVSDGNRVVIVNREGEVMWEKQISGCGRAIRF